MNRSTSSSSSSSSSTTSTTSPSTSSPFAALGFTESSASSAVTEKIAAGGASISLPSSSYSQSPRRAFSLPSKIKLPFTTSPLTSPNINIGLGSPMIPLHSPTRSTARRFSYNMKSRISHYSLPLTVGGLFTLALFIYVSLNSSNEVRRFNSSSRLQLYGRSRFSEEEHQMKLAHPLLHVPDNEPDNGISLLLDEEELIAEDDLFWDSYKDPEPLSREEAKQQEELKAHKADVIRQDKLQSLRALIWWLAEGGILPNDWEVPTKQYLKKIGGRGMERLLEDIDSGEEGDEIFDNGWAEFANRRYRVVVFSKTHCPYSKKAKSIFGEYHISPAPFIIELDQRSDMEKIQTLLQRITGRRTVPNVLLDFVSIGGSDDVTLLHSEGGLQRTLEDMEVLPFSRRRRPAVPLPPPPPPPPPPVVEEPVLPVKDEVALEEVPVQGNNELKRHTEQEEQEAEENAEEDESDDETLITPPSTPKVESEDLTIQDGVPIGTDSQPESEPEVKVEQGNFVDLINRNQLLHPREKQTNAERFMNKRREAPGTGTLGLTSRDERGSWKEGSGLLV
ncbi:glutaredoxin [Kwoniella bestiolae CBS 10118]|uniref:Glutaredoxin n=1 Tax=Kwoniella bestiolae CBS 10118 TaxID=1296100 RepID=A0A1B9FRX2_9TREE|nr:glutaredoxin [Kwoniella bestiolae CBS 10118]OCF21527.1 glutaredoxin [Kwoniella bestiolae CBS 10118]